MATVYVSNSTANGYSIGNDSNTYAQMQSKVTPSLTLVGALGKVVAGDTIIINDGTYLEASFPTVSVANVTINAQNDYLAIIQAGAGSFALRQLPAATGLTLNKIVIDARNINKACLVQDTSNVANLTIHGTHFINFTGNALTSPFCQNITMDGGWLAQSTVSNSPNVISLNPTVAGTISIKDGTIDITAAVATAGNLYCISVIPTVVGCNLVIKNNTITFGSKNASQYICGMHLAGVASYDISGNTLTETTVQTAGGYDGILIDNSALATSKCWIYNNTINGGNPNPDINATGHNINVGTDGDADSNPNSISGLWVYGNKLYNMNHMLLIGFETGAVIQGNYCENGVIGVIGKHTSNCVFSGNILVNITSGGALRMKASSGDVFTNNTVVLKKPTGVGMMASASTPAGSQSTGGSFKNNIIYMDNVAAKAVSIVDTSDATFAKNDYYSAAGFTAGAFVYNAGSYNTVSAWSAAQEATALNVDPGFASYPTDLRIPAGTVLYHAGVYVGVQNTDYRGRPFYVTPTIGAFEVTSRDPSAPRTRRPQIE